MSRVYVEKPDLIGFAHDESWVFAKCESGMVYFDSYCGEDVELDASQARKLAAKLNKFADEIEKRKES